MKENGAQSKGRNWEAGQERLHWPRCEVAAGSPGASRQNGENWLDSGCILEVDVTRLAIRLDT